MKKYDKNLLLAMSVGDGYISKTGALEIKHSIKQLEYLMHKKQILEKIFKRDLKTYEDIKSKIPSIKISISHRYLKFLKTFLYSNNKKIINKKVLNRLSLEGIAIWYMDKGCLCTERRNNKPHTYTLSISTCADTLEQIKIIIEYFKNVHNIDFKIKKYGNKFSLRCGKKEAVKFCKLIEYYVPNFMSYKINGVLHGAPKDIYIHGEEKV